jgi:phenylpyruvate tautomerase PptA (4-oxalocrotonate tautomerase family)
MPLVRIDLNEGRTPAQIAALGDAVHRAMVETIDVPRLDRFQIITAHALGTLIADPEYLGIKRSKDVVVIQITLNEGRTLEKKKALYGAIVRNLAADAGFRPEDVLVNLVEVAKADWSFGSGIAQYVV